MRVLVYGLVGTNRGGIETFLLKMNGNMSDEMIFDYVVEGNECIHEQEIKKKGGKIYYIPNRHNNPFSNIKANIKLLKSLKKEYESVYLNLSSLSWIFPILIAKKYGYKLFVHSHNAEFVKNNSGFIYKFVNKINKFILHKMHIIRLTCSVPATEFMFNKKDEVQMIYNAIDISKFSFNEQKREEIRNSLGVDNQKVIGFVGRINDQKNPLFLPQIMDELKKICNSTMIILGDGPMKEQLLNEIKGLNLTNDIICCGNVTNVNDYLSAMDIFVLPSIHEGLPYVLVEAQTSGLPCVVSDAITREVDALGIITFVSLGEGPMKWANIINECDNKNVKDRELCGVKMEKSYFNIKNESNKLEKILKGNL